MQEAEYEEAEYLAKMLRTAFRNYKKEILKK